MKKIFLFLRVATGLILVSSSLNFHSIQAQATTGLEAVQLGEALAEALAPLNHVDLDRIIRNRWRSDSYEVIETMNPNVNTKNNDFWYPFVGTLCSVIGVSDISRKLPHLLAANQMDEATAWAAVVVLSGIGLIGVSIELLHLHYLEQPGPIIKRTKTYKQWLAKIQEPSEMSKSIKTLQDSFLADYNSLRGDVNTDDAKMSKLFKRTYLEGSTLAHLAALRNDAEVIRKIAAASGKLYARDIYGRQPMELALQTGAPQAFKELYKQLRTDRKIKTYDRYVMKLLKTQIDNIFDVVTSFEHNLPILDESKSDEWTALYGSSVAAQNDPAKLSVFKLASHDIVRGSTLEKFNFLDDSLRTVDQHNNTLLHLAIASGNMKAVQTLMQKEAPILVQNDEGFRFLDALKLYINKIEQILKASRDIINDAQNESANNNLNTYQEQVTQLKEIVTTNINKISKVAPPCRKLLQNQAR